MSKWQLATALGAAVVGSVILAAWFARYWPAAHWTVVPSAQLVAKGRQVSEHFGLNTTDWKDSETATISKSLARYTSEHSLDVSPLSVRIKFAAKKGGQSAQVGFDSAGQLNYWRPPENFKSAQKFASDEEGASEAFRYIAGAKAGSYKGPVRHMGDEDHEQDYVWKKTPIPNSEARESIEVATRDGVVWRVERKTSIPSDDEDSEDDYRQDYWDIIGGIFGLMCTVGVIVILSIYVLWLVRRAIDHQFPIRMAVLALVVMIIVGRAGFHWTGTAVKFDQLIGALFMTGIIFCFVAVGRGISAKTLPKWMSLEQLCLLAPIAKRTGESLAAGVLFSPLLVAIPFVIAGCGLFPHSWVLPHNAELLYSRTPTLDSVNMQMEIYLLGFFGFLTPVMERLARFRLLRWLMILPLGTLFFTNATRVISGPVAAPLTAGFLTLAVFWFVWAQFDLLAVLTLQISSGFLLTMLMLGQRGSLMLGGLLIAAGWCYVRGKAVAQGDPRATNPKLSGFRDERAKLRAEFSVARRAQQDMLPRTPPSIPGYTIAVSCTPSLEVGGDLYDFLKLKDGRIGIGVADVSGKGVSAALYMTLTKGLLAAVTRNSSDLASVVEEVNRHLHGVTRKKVFVTMVLGFLDAERRLLQCARAGHNPVVWRQAARDLTTLVAPGGLGLGITASRVFGTQLKIEDMELSDGDAVVFYSDGITEAMNGELEQFGEQRLMDAVQKTDKLDATAARDSILGEVREFLDGIHPQDDMTLVVLRVGEFN